MSVLDKKIKRFEKLEISEQEREVSKLDDFISLLEHQGFNSDDVKKYIFTKKAKRLSSILAGIILEIIGFDMILLFKANEYTHPSSLKIVFQDVLNIMDIFGFSDFIGAAFVGIGMTLLIIGLRMPKS